ncbi:hypothetical protein SSX86_002065 [Deinandra increscens subsp. villosa]|uniref:Zinc finger MYM-type protein 1 n=1 Tax=Deinandra increscens subsp. villosa TaxID=3103831 RepID=A0AAP0DVP8_9ASTR
MPPKYLSGSQRRKKRKLDEKMRKSQAGALYKFFSKQHVEEHEEQENVEAHVEQENVEKQVEDHEEVEQENVSENVYSNPADIFDPRRWDGLNSDEIKLLVEKGLKRDTNIINYPKDKLGRHFSAAMYARTLSNMEKCDRESLIYSKELDRVFCFCCKVFRKGPSKGKLDGEGYSDWIHASNRLKEHEVSLDHLTNMTNWFDMRKRLKLNETIEKYEYEQFKKERDYWKQVILRIIALVKYLAKHNLAFRGSNEKLYKKGNGNFLGAIEMLEEFDPVIKEHVRRITNDDGIHVHYLGHKIQNEIILLLAKEIKKEIIKKIREAKYYSIILDCTPDTSHQEQMTLIVRYVNFSSNSVTIEEPFLGFLNVDDTTGKGLFDVTFEELKCLGLEIDDMSGQGYDNGSNMKGKHSGVQKRFLDENPRAFYTPCGCHSLNLTLCDMANSCGKDNVKTLSLKSLSATRWESRVESVKAIKDQLADVREALLEVGEKDNDSKIQSEAKSLAKNELGDFEFLVSIVIWHHVLNMVNTVSKKLQAKDMVLDNAIKEINKLIQSFKGYRETGFPDAIDEAKRIAIEMGVDPIFPERRQDRRKKHFDETSSDKEVTFLAEDNFKVNYFLYIIDQASVSLEKRFDQYREYEKLFGFLFPNKLRELEDNELKSCCRVLQDDLKFHERTDIDADDLFMELKLFDRLQTDEVINPTYILKNVIQFNCFPNASIAYRILLTIPVTVASAERSFSKLKLLKSYLRSIMSQERLSVLAIIAIENEILEDMNYEDLINQFAIKNARRFARFVG